MAIFNPIDVIPITALTATPGTSVLTGTTGHIYIIRTLHVSTSGSAKAFTFSQGADAAGTRLFDAVVLTQNVPSIYNGWWAKTSAGAAHLFDASISSTTAQLYGGGYDYS